MGMIGAMTVMNTYSFSDKYVLDSGIETWRVCDTTFPLNDPDRRSRKQRLNRLFGAAPSMGIEMLYQFGNGSA
jgi:hypothetical protein